ncbi:GNAT family N-acetyltransferase [Microbacterium sp. CFBP9034]|uniref:GNAT family N-acetyltransferase n=1 Tax=Microbacterium sp. CFBP9034 TaxID=3096540 RepID=UPI002A6B4B65|nr:GNAT family N-acetyltransferase [Microbacterium sp. CFBP9034]MDY0909413.1 GNAT family N-acetyltransferase [Microbacterium sp. CFBP9034]
MTTISRITAEDRPAWDALWQAYITFYESEVPADVTESTFARILADEHLHGAIARDSDGRAVGLVHWLTHPATWTTGVYCYLEDLFVDPGARGSGTGRGLIEHVRDWAHRFGATKVYWLTADDNATARTLYDKVATSTGFVQYEIEL